MLISEGMSHKDVLATEIRSLTLKAPTTNASENAIC